MNRRQWSGAWHFMGAQQLQAQSPQNHPKENSTESPGGAKVRLPGNNPKQLHAVSRAGKVSFFRTRFFTWGFFCCPFNSYGQTEEYSQEPSA